MELSAILLTKHRERELRKGLLNRLAGLCAAAENAPAFGGQPSFSVRIDFPLRREITLVQHEDGGNFPHRFRDPMGKSQRILERLAARAVGDEQVARHAAEV